MKKLMEQFCLWYLKKYWNSKAYKAEQARLTAAKVKSEPAFMRMQQGVAK